jgi:hypothetical protein
MGRSVTALTAHCGVLALENPTSFLMIKTFDRWFPPDERKIFAVVFRVAGRATLAGRGFVDDKGVESRAFRDPGCNFTVTFKTFESSKAT